MASISSSEHSTLELGLLRVGLLKPYIRIELSLILLPRDKRKMGLRHGE